MTGILQKKLAPPAAPISSEGIYCVVDELLL